MLLKTSRDGVKKAFDYLARLPFTKTLLHKVSEIARGKCVAFFSLSRLLDDNDDLLSHPHFLNKSALTQVETRSLLAQIQKTLPFVSLSEALSLLKGDKVFKHSVAVLLLEAPYRMSIKNLMPLIDELNIPLAIALCPHSIRTGEQPWVDEVIFRVMSTAKEELQPNFVDRAFSLGSNQERLLAANHLVENLSNCSERLLHIRLLHLRELLHETALLPRSERIASSPELLKLSQHPLVSFVVAGLNKMPVFELDPDAAHREMLRAKEELGSLIGEALLPVFFYTLPLAKNRSVELSKIMLRGGYEAAINKTIGLARPGDNMFRLPCLPLSPSSTSFSKFELQGLADAIDEFLLVTLAKNEEL